MNRLEVLVVGVGLLLAGAGLTGTDEQAVGGSMMLLGAFLLVALIVTAPRGRS